MTATPAFGLEIVQVLLAGMAEAVGLHGAIVRVEQPLLARHAPKGSRAATGATGLEPTWRYILGVDDSSARIAVAEARSDPISAPTIPDRPLAKPRAGAQAKRYPPNTQPWPLSLELEIHVGSTSTKYRMRRKRY